MGVLTEYLKTEAEQIRAEMSRREEGRREWGAALGRLYDQLEEWLRGADNGLGLLTVERRVEAADAGEPLVGIDRTMTLYVSLGGVAGIRRAVIAPRGRYVGASIRPPGEAARRADGMAEIRGGSAADYYLFRLAGANPDEDRWFIRSVSQWNSDPDYGKVEPLDRERFEAAMLRVLQ